MAQEEQHVVIVGAVADDERLAVLEAVITSFRRMVTQMGMLEGFQVFLLSNPWLDLAFIAQTTFRLF